MRLVRISAALTACAALACSSTPIGPADASIDTSAGDSGCQRDVDCDDGLFCDGMEHCTAGTCVAGSSPCTASQTCDEAMDLCQSACDAMPDADGDGARSIACGGTDCDDADPTTHPGAVETCDVLDHDEDCDPRTFGVRDGDADGSADALCCNGSGTDRHCGTDCDDASSSVHPGEAESCDGLDNDCDSAIDEMAVGLYYPDCDEDGYGDANVTPLMACALPPTRPPGCLGPTAQWATIGRDCDDTEPLVRPGVPEVCDGIDDDCDPTTLGTDADADADGHLSGRCCNAQPDGSIACAGHDCEPADPLVHPGAAEACNARDEDCDWRLDEGLSGCTATDPGAGAVQLTPSCSCSGATPVCCPNGSPSCVEPAIACTGAVGRFECDGSEDCATGSGCCVTTTSYDTHCGDPSSCATLVCASHEDCPMDRTCTVPIPFLGGAGAYHYCER